MHRERKKFRRPDVRRLLVWFSPFLFCTSSFRLRIIILILSPYKIAQARVYRPLRCEIKSGAKTFHTELLYFAKQKQKKYCNISHVRSSSLFIWRHSPVLVRWRRLMNWLMKIRSIKQIKITHHDWMKRKWCKTEHTNVALGRAIKIVLKPTDWTHNYITPNGLIIFKIINWCMWISYRTRFNCSTMLCAMWAVP